MPLMLNTTGVTLVAWTTYISLGVFYHTTGGRSPTSAMIFIINFYDDHP
jgi:hypothetical protein